MTSPENNPSWILDYGLLEDLPAPGDDLPSSLEQGFHWPPNAFTSSSLISLEVDDSLVNSDDLKENPGRKRMMSGSCAASSSKARREKIRRDRLNDRFLELGFLLETGRQPKMDKASILNDAVRMVTQLHDEVQKHKQLNDNLQEKINELKTEKTELHDEKQRLKAEKESLELKVKSLNTQSAFLPHPPAIATPFLAQGQVVSGKLVPFIQYPGVSMWQFMSPAAVDTSQDHVLRPPVA